MTKNQKKELLRTLKYVVIAASAGAIQLITSSILMLIWPAEKFAMGPVLFYIIGLALSVIWNLTINRKYTFKSASNMTRAVWLTVAFYAIFTPASCLLQAWLTNGNILDTWHISYINWPEIAGVIICMIINLGLEYPYQRFVLFGKSIDTNELAKENKE